MVTDAPLQGHLPAHGGRGRLAGVVELVDLGRGGSQLREQFGQHRIHRRADGRALQVTRPPPLGPDEDRPRVAGREGVAEPDLGEVGPVAGSVRP